MISRDTLPPAPRLMPCFWRFFGLDLVLSPISARVGQSDLFLG